MRDVDIRTTRFDRDHLPELFQGTVAGDKRTSLSQLAEDPSLASGLTAVWAPTGERLNPLPHLILGSREALTDLCAWSKAFMAGVGPLSGLLRLVRPEQLKEFQEVREVEAPRDLDAAGRQVSIILAEVAARSAVGAATNRIGLKTCVNTLAFAIFRAENCRLKIEPEELASRWSAVRRSDKRSGQNRVTEAVLATCRSALRDLPAGSDPLLAHTHTMASGVDRNLELPLEPGDDAGDVLTRLLSDPAIARRPKEDLVRMVDGILPGLARGRPREPREYLLVALLVAQTTRGLSNQLALLGPAASRLPELIMSLGAVQGSSPSAEVLSSYNGVGWKMLSRLTERLDLFKRPECDISFEEANLYNPLGHGTEVGDGGRLSIEIAWGITTEVTVDRLDGKNETSDQESFRYKNPPRGMVSTMEAVEQRLMEAMDMIRRLRDEQTGRRR